MPDLPSVLTLLWMLCTVAVAQQPTGEPHAPAAPTVHPIVADQVPAPSVSMGVRHRSPQNMLLKGDQEVDHVPDHLHQAQARCWT